MVIKTLDDVEREEMKNLNGVTKQIVIGPADGSDEIVLRVFTLKPGGATPHHHHSFPHLVRIEAGSGVAVNESGEKSVLRAGQFVYVAPDEVHHFENAGSEPFRFICVVPRRGEL